MPHSSGGGSHSGGSHGGSHHSSHSHGGSGRSSRHVRSTYFPDARRYVYYDHHRPVYVYADYDITEKRSPLRFLMLLFYLPVLMIAGIITGLLIGLVAGLIIPSVRKALQL